MTRRQMNIPGTEGTVNPAVEEAAVEWRDARKEAKAAAERAKEKKFALIALMQASSVAKYKYTDEDTGEEILVSLEDEPKLRAKKTGEVDEPIGDGVDDGELDDAQDGKPRKPKSDVHEGLIAQAERSMAASNVEESADGDVVVPDTMAPKGKKRGAKSKPAETQPAEQDADQVH